MTGFIHLPVLVEPVLRFLQVAPDGVYFDGTVGSGGHAEAILEASAPGGRLIGCDRDPLQLQISAQRLARFGDRVTLVRGSYEDAVEILRSAHFENVDGFVIDCGASLDQLSPEGEVGRGRGFSWRTDEPLLMSYDPDSERTAARLLAESSEAELREVFLPVLRPGEVGRVVRAIVRRRRAGPIETTRQLTEALRSAFGPPGPAADRRIAAAYLAVRAATNLATDALLGGIDAAVEVLRPGGVLVVIAFHGLETRVVRNRLRELEGGPVGPPRLVGAPERPKLMEVLTPRPIAPTDAEVNRNPAARSAKLFAGRKV